MFKKLVLGSVCSAAVMFTASDASAFHGHYRRGNSCGYGGDGYSVPVLSYAPSYGHGYGRSFYYRPPISIGIGGLPYGYRSGFGGYGYGGYPGYGFGRSGLSIGFGSFGRGW